MVTPGYGIRRIYIALSTMAVLSCAAPGQTYYGFTIGISSAPPPPRVVFYEEPSVVVVPGSEVYVVADNTFEYDMFRYAGDWYLVYDGYWYRSSSYRGSFTVIDVRSVPQQVVEVPSSHWKHHPHGGPPGQERKHGGSPS
jgi:hypothetical protein